MVERPDLLQDLIGTADLVVSLLPSTLHYLVAEVCINAGVHLVTASYCTDELKEMHDRYVTDMCKISFILSGGIMTRIKNS